MYTIVRWVNCSELFEVEVELGLSRHSPHVGVDGEPLNPVRDASSILSKEST